jgi:hypothetical protein
MESRLLIVAFAAMVACGGSSLGSEQGDAGRGDGEASNAEVAGVSAQNGDAGSAGEISGRDGAQTPEVRVGAAFDAALLVCGCDYTSTLPCSESTLFDAVNKSASANSFDPGCGEAKNPDTAVGYVSFDDYGQITKNSIFHDDSLEQAWLDSLADYRWPCLSKTQLFFTCPSFTF